jgi:hypothetical protein
MDAMRPSIVVALVAAVLAACSGSTVEEPRASPAVVALEPAPPAAAEPKPDDAPAPRDDVPSDVRAAKGTTVRVVLAPDSPFAGPLYASLRHCYEPGDDPDGIRRRLEGPSHRVAFDGDRSATFRVDGAGRYSVELDVERIGRRISAGGTLGSGASVRRRERMRTIPAEPVVTVGGDAETVEVVVSLVLDEER